MEDKLLTVRESAELLTISYSLMRKWIERGLFPKPLRLNSSCRYRESTILNWIKEREAAQKGGNEKTLD